MISYVISSPSVIARVFPLPLIGVSGAATCAARIWNSLPPLHVISATSARQHLSLLTAFSTTAVPAY